MSLFGTNAATRIPARYYTKTQPKKPNPPKNKAVVGHL